MTPTNRLRQLSDALLAHRDHMLKARHNLTGPQYDVLYVLHTNDAGNTAWTIGGMADFLGCYRGNLTGLVDRLERDGWVRRERSTADRRIIYVAIAPGAEKRVAQAAADVAALQAQWDELLAGALPVMEEALARVG